MKLLLAITAFLIVTFNPKAQANELLYSVDLSARSYSPGLSLTPSVAYKIWLWGDESTPFAGSLKPKISAIASPATYGARAELEFSPVTFLNLTAGKTYLRRFSHFDDDSCRYNNCVGSLNSTDLSARLLFKMNAFLGSLKYTKVFFDEKDDKSQGLVDPTTYMLISPNNEVADQLEGILGYAIDDSWTGGVLIQHIELKKNLGVLNGQYLVAMKKNGQTTYTAGLGRFESALKPVKPSLIFSFKYDWK